jgi:hypothetical protein
MSKHRTNPFTTNQRKALKASGWNVLRQFHRTVIRRRFELDFGDGDIRSVHARIKKVGPIMFSAEIEKTAKAERFKTIEEALQHIEDRKTVMLALGVMDPSTRPGIPPMKTWSTAEWARNAIPVGASVPKTTLDPSKSAEILARARNLRKHLR